MNKSLAYGWAKWLAALLFCLPLLMVPATAADLFTVVTADQARDANPAQARQIEQIRQRRTSAAMILVRPNVNALGDASTQIALPDARVLDFKKSNIETRTANDYTWFGALSGTPGQATLVVRDGNITGSIREDRQLYRIEPVGNGMHALIKIDETRFPPEHPPSFKDLEKRGAAGAAASRGDSATLDGPVGITVLVAYTTAARTAVPDIAATILLAVAEANQSYLNSGVNIRLSMVDTFEVPYSESGKSYDTILADMVAMGTINTRRNSSGADMAVMIINQSDYCGMADAIRATAATAYAVVHYDCATGYYSFAHELGHLQGARHDPPNDPSIAPFAYGHGMQHAGPSNWRTIMAYNCTPSCPRLQYWSSPHVNYAGVAMGTAASNDNARVLNETASTVAGFRSVSASTIGSVWRDTGAPCSGASCPGWQKIDNNAATARIAAAGSKLYQLHSTGKIWESTGVACVGASCPGWKMLDNNAATKGIVTDGTQLYQLHNNGKIWLHTGVACTGASCPGWKMLDNNPATVAIVADSGKLYQVHNSGKIFRYTGVACSGNACPGWQMIDNNPATVSITAGGGALYQLHDSGKTWRFTGTACVGNSCPGWQMLDNNPATIAIVASDKLYQMHGGGKIWRSTGVPCSGTSCPGWIMLDNNPATIAIYANAGKLYQLHNSGKTWTSTGAACGGASCPGWTMVDNNPNTGRIAAGGGKLYQLHQVRSPMTRARICYECI